ncbi:unnamed protein product [Allacma fusca]|uniref:Gustatory receptor n=1 Tax=Allacma fusca TaxID=39272 RepID=A0A8J2NW38_9HEXA|nr:unnamed protein product [Allacma fusca]
MEFEKPKNKILDELWPVLVILRCLGKIPITKKNGESSYNWRSFHFLYSVILTTIYLIVWIMTIANAGFRTTWFHFILRPSTATADSILASSSSVISLIAKSYFIVQPFSYIVDFTLPWINLPQNLEILNRWSEFQSYFENGICDHEFYPLEFSLRRSRTRFIIWATVPSALGIIIFTGEQLAWDPIVNTFIGTCLALSMTFVSFMEDVMLNLHYKAVEQSFHLIRNRVRDFPNDDVTSNIARGWTNLVLLLREQNKRICKSKATHQLVWTFLAIILLTMYIFLVMQCLTSELGPETTTIAAVCFLYSFINFARIYCKCVAAEKLTNAEKLLAQDLIPKIVVCDNLLTKSELQFLHDVIINQPTTVTYGGITFNRGFLLSMISHIITYLVILIQFNVNQIVDEKSRSG